MKHSIIKALGLTAALATGGFAQASTVATAYLNVDNAMFTDSTGTILNSSLFTFQNAKNDTSVSTALGSYGSSPAGSGQTQQKLQASILAGNGGLDVYSAKGSNGPVDNAFTTPTLNPAVDEFAVSDTKLVGGLLNFGQGQSGAYGDVYDSVSLKNNSEGTADAVVGSTSLLIFTPTIDLSGFFKFTLSDYLKVWVDPGMSGDSSATAKGVFSLSLVDKTTGFVGQSGFTAGNYSYNIGGDAAGFTTYGGGSQTLLNTEITNNLIANSLAYTLKAGHSYQFLLTQDTYASATNVPEPGSLALMGLGLLGLGALRKKSA